MLKIYDFGNSKNFQCGKFQELRNIDRNVDPHPNLQDEIEIQLVELN